MKTRRFAAALVAGSLVAATVPDDAIALFLRSGVVQSGGPVQLKYFVVTNTSGSTQAAGSVSQMRNFTFADGQMLPGQWPQFFIAGGMATPVPCTLLSTLASYWPSGCLKLVPGMVSNPISISAGASINVGIFTQGSLPSPSPRSLSDAVNNLTPQLQFDLLDAGWRTQTTGYVADLADAIASPIKTISYGNGACGAFYRVTTRVAFGGTPDGQMTCDIYVAVLANLDGSFKGLRFALRPMFPYYDLNTNPMDWVSFSRLQFVDASTSTVLFDAFSPSGTTAFGSGRAVNFEGPGNLVLNASFTTSSNTLSAASVPAWITAGMYVYDYSQGLQVGRVLLTTSTTVVLTANSSCNSHGSTDTILFSNYQVAGGSSPSTLVITSGTPWSSNNGGDCGYCVRASGANIPSNLPSTTSFFTQSPTSTTISVGTSSSGEALGQISPASACSGTLTPYPYLCYFNGVWLANLNGKMIFVQGAGSDSADTPLRISLDAAGQSAELSTRLYPSYDLTIPAPTDKYSTPGYWINGNADNVQRNFENPGERADLGVFNGWSATHFYTQTANAEEVVRCTSLVGGQLRMVFLNSTTLTMPCCNNGHNGGGATYSGMPAPNYSFVGNGGGWTDTTNPNVSTGGFGSYDMSHMSAFNYYAYLTFGEPMHLDMLREHFNFVIYDQPSGLQTATISLTSWAFRSNTDGTTRNVRLNSSLPYRYASLALPYGEPRLWAWSCRDIATYAGVAPKNDPDCAGYPAYAFDVFTDTGQTWADLLSVMTTAGMTFALDNGLFLTPSTGGYLWSDQWMESYFVDAMCMGINHFQDPNWIAALENLVTKYDFVVNTYSGWHMTEQMMTRVGPSGPTTSSPLAIDPTQIGFQGTNISWNGTTSQYFTNNMTNNSVAWSNPNGATVVFGFNGPSSATATPAGFNRCQAYYVINASGNQFQLSASYNGPAMTIQSGDSNASNNGTVFYVTWGLLSNGATPPADTTGSSISPMNVTGYNTFAHGVLGTATASGHGPQTGTYTDFAERDIAFGISYTSDVRYARTNTYPAPVVP